MPAVLTGNAIRFNNNTETEVPIVPIGAIILYGNSSYVPVNYILCNGVALSRTGYSALFSKIGTTYGAGNGSTTFNIPDLTEKFVRGWDNGRGVDPGRTFGSNQTSRLELHSHTTNAQGGHLHYGNTGNENVDHSHWYFHGNRSNSQRRGGPQRSNNGGFGANTGGFNSNHTHGFNTNGISANHTHGVGSVTAGDGFAGTPSESAPRSVGLSFFIRIL